MTLDLIIPNYKKFHSLDLEGTAITALPEGLTVGATLYLFDTAIMALPGGLTVGRCLFLSHDTVLATAVKDCGKYKRSIAAYYNLSNQPVISIGCFVGSMEQAIEAIKRKYVGDDANLYIQKVETAFNLLSKTK